MGARRLCDALRFILGCARAPVDGDQARDEGFFAAYARGFLRHVAAILMAAKRAAHAAAYGWSSRSFYGACLHWRALDASYVPKKKGRESAVVKKAAWNSRSTWLGRRSLHDVWSGARQSRLCFGAWRAYVAACGPRAMRAWRDAERRRIERRGEQCV